MKIQKKIIFFLGGWGWGGGGGRVGGCQVGGQGGCERRSKVFVKIQKKNLLGGGWVGVGGGGPIRGWSGGGEG